jgi:hypothetical protein
MYESPKAAPTPSTPYLVLLARLLVNPRDAVERLRASRPVVRSVAAAALMTALYGASLRGTMGDVLAVIRLSAFDPGAKAIIADHFAFLVPLVVLTLLVIGVAYVPLALVLLGALNRVGRSPGLVAGNLSGIVAAAMTVWAFTLALWLVPAMLLADPYLGRSVAVWSVLPILFFLGLMSLALAGVADAGPARGSAASVLAGATLVGIFFARLLVGGMRSLVALLALILVARLVYSMWSASRDARDRHRRNLEDAALNPADARAQLDLGIYYEEQGDVDRAVDHYLSAAEADPGDVTAVYRLGRIARSRDELAKAIAWFDAVVQVDDSFSTSEVWREVGWTYHAANQFDDARSAFERFLERRPSDAEGRYGYAVTLEALGERDGARTQMSLLVDAVRGGPAYKQRLERDWLVRAERYLKGETGRS